MEKKRIIVVEDDGIISIEIRHLLEAMGYEVVSSVASGEEAVKEALEKIPDLILMDIKLIGKMDGIEAAEKINSKINVPIIYLTSYSDKATVKRAEQTKPMDYILKPFDNVELYSRIETALYEHKKRALIEKNKAGKTEN